MWIDASFRFAEIDLSLDLVNWQVLIGSEGNQVSFLLLWLVQGQVKSGHGRSPTDGLLVGSRRAEEIRRKLLEGLDRRGLRLSCKLRMASAKWRLPMKKTFLFTTVLRGTPIRIKAR